VLWCDGLGCGLFGVNISSHGGACDGSSLFNVLYSDAKSVADASGVSKLGYL
jgi:hypothetical protein